MIIMALFINIVFLGSALTIMLVYVWSRRNPFVRMNFFGLLNFQAPYLPWVLLAFSLLLGNSIIVDLMGIIVGHIYYFCEDVFPRQEGGFRILKTPRFLYVTMFDLIGLGKFLSLLIDVGYSKIQLNVMRKIIPNLMQTTMCHLELAVSIGSDQISCFKQKKMSLYFFCLFFFSLAISLFYFISIRLVYLCWNKGNIYIYI